MTFAPDAQDLDFTAVLFGKAYVIRVEVVKQINKRMLKPRPVRILCQVFWKRVNVFSSCVNQRLKLLCFASTKLA